MGRNRENLREVEVSPDGRYIRFDQKLGTGAYKEVWLSYDTETGKEMAWNTVQLKRLPMNEKKRITMETRILAQLSHPHIINFYNHWMNEEKEEICFATEIMTSGTLKQYISRINHIKLKVVKDWCRQILNGLAYLHSLDRPIIHRDLKCDNIFINGSTGEIRIGDFGLSSYQQATHAHSVLGTPEFMAPELYDEDYSEKVDIYAFGMCVLEMTTKEYPYEECTNAAQIWKRVSNHKLPESLNRIKEPTVRSFIELCLHHDPDMRLTARELLNHPFLSWRHSDPLRDNCVVKVLPRGEVPERQNSHSPPLARTSDLYNSGVLNGANIRSQSSGGSRAAVCIPSDGSDSTVSRQPLSSFKNKASQAFVDRHSTLGQPTRSPIFKQDLRLRTFTTDQSSFSPITSPQTTLSRQEEASSPKRPNLGLQAIADANCVEDHQCEISLHLVFASPKYTDGASTKKKKAIRFKFDLLSDTCEGVVGEMIHALKLPDPENSFRLISRCIDEKVEPLREAYFLAHPEMRDFEQITPNRISQPQCFFHLEQGFGSLSAKSSSRHSTSNYATAPARSAMATMPASQLDPLYADTRRFSLSRARLNSARSLNDEDSLSSNLISSQPQHLRTLSFSNKSQLVLGQSITPTHCTSSLLDLLPQNSVGDFASVTESAAVIESYNQHPSLSLHQSINNVTSVEELTAVLIREYSSLSVPALREQILIEGGSDDSFNELIEKTDYVKELVRLYFIRHPQLLAAMHSHRNTTVDLLPPQATRSETFPSADSLMPMRDISAPFAFGNIFNNVAVDQQPIALHRLSINSALPSSIAASSLSPNDDNQQRQPLPHLKRDLSAGTPSLSQMHLQRTLSVLSSHGSPLIVPAPISHLHDQTESGDLNQFLSNMSSQDTDSSEPRLMSSLGGSVNAIDSFMDVKQLDRASQSQPKELLDRQSLLHVHFAGSSVLSTSDPAVFSECASVATVDGVPSAVLQPMCQPIEEEFDCPIRHEGSGLSLEQAQHLTSIRKMSEPPLDMDPLMSSPVKMKFDPFIEQSSADNTADRTANSIAVGTAKSNINSFFTPVFDKVKKGAFKSETDEQSDSDIGSINLNASAPRNVDIQPGRILGLTKSDGGSFFPDELQDTAKSDTTADMGKLSSGYLAHFRSSTTRNFDPLGDFKPDLTSNCMRIPALSDLHRTSAPATMSGRARYTSDENGTAASLSVPNIIDSTRTI